MTLDEFRERTRDLSGHVEIIAECGYYDGVIYDKIIGLEKTFYDDHEKRSYDEKIDESKVEAIILSFGVL